MSLDLIIRNGTVVDGSGAPRYRMDIGVRDGIIVETGRIRTTATRTIDADGLIVSPGFIDGHTHMDAQVTWDPLGTCSCWHGVTSVLMGNCGFALAPCKPEEREWYARCLEAVEDIPSEAIMTGVKWDWETFPEFLTSVDKAPKAINYGAYIGHSALRMYVMGGRALDEEASDKDIELMARLVKEAVESGAMGFSTSRSPTHLTPNNTPVPSRVGSWHEINGIVASLAELNAGIIQIGPDISSAEAQKAFFENVKRIALETGRPIMFPTATSVQGKDPQPWHYYTDFLDNTTSLGGRIYGQATTRSINVLWALKGNLPFDQLPTWKIIRALPIEEQKRSLADSDTRAKLIAEEADMRPRGAEFQGGGLATTNPMRPDYAGLFIMRDVEWEDQSVEEVARAANKNPTELMIDLMLDDEDQIFVQPLINEMHSDVLAFLKHPRTLATFSDSGAHVCQEMGSSLPTHLLNYWVRKKEEFTLEQAVRMLTFDNATAFELPNRGLIRKGYAADLVIFEEENIKPGMPKVMTDLPGGAKRLVQKAEGITTTVVNGAITLENGESTGNYMGKLLKGPLAN